MVVSALLAGWGGAAGFARGASVGVSPSRSLADQPVHLTIRGLRPGQVVTLRVSSTDFERVPWSSSEKFAADQSGVVDVDRVAPRSGSYTGVWGMGAIAMMHADARAPAGAYFWDGDNPMRFTATVIAAGRPIAHASFVRRASASRLVLKTETLRTAGFDAQFVYRDGVVQHSAVLLLGGSEGGIPGALDTAALAARGYPVLALAYFKAPGLPTTLSRIPLEYFAKALRWMRRQPQIDPRRIAVLGVSRGSEAAQLLGVHFPSLVHAVIGMVPSDVSLCSYPGCLGPAWTFRGRAVPFTTHIDNPHPSDDPSAVIPVQRIRGPVFLDCGKRDQVWTSCSYAKAIIGRLDAVRDRFAHVLYTYASAGHLIGDFSPYEPATRGAFEGDDPQADQRAIAQDWPRLLAFLSAISRR